MVSTCMLGEGDTDPPARATLTWCSRSGVAAGRQPIPGGARRREPSIPLRSELDERQVSPLISPSGADKAGGGGVGPPAAAATARATEVLELASY